MMVSVLAAVLEFQRDMISENTREGVAAAEAVGKTLGRPTALDPRTATAIVAPYRQGAAVKALARQHQVAPKTIRRVLDAAGARDLPGPLDMPPVSPGELDVALAHRWTWSSTYPDDSPISCESLGTRSSAWPSSQDGSSAAAPAIRSVWWPHLRFTAPCWSKALPTAPAQLSARRTECTPPASQPSRPPDCMGHELRKPFGETHSNGKSRQAAQLRSANGTFRSDARHGPRPSRQWRFERSMSRVKRPRWTLGSSDRCNT
jgi:hypothetical protein